jgi:hypothetical protein
MRRAAARLSLMHIQSLAVEALHHLVQRLMQSLYTCQSCFLPSTVSHQLTALAVLLTPLLAAGVGPSDRQIEEGPDVPG